MDPVEIYTKGLKGYEGVRVCAEIFEEVEVNLQEAPRSLLKGF